MSISWSDCVFSGRQSLDWAELYGDGKECRAVDDPALHEAISTRIKESDRSLGAIARVIIEELTRFSGCSRVCLKFPVDVRHIPELMEWFPDGKVVHITRDPRGSGDVQVERSFWHRPDSCSRHPYLAWPIRKAALAVVISNYRLSARMHRQLNGNANYRLFRYEDLLAAAGKDSA